MITPGPRRSTSIKCVYHATHVSSGNSDSGKSDGSPAASLRTPVKKVGTTINMYHAEGNAGINLPEKHGGEFLLGIGGKQVSTEANNMENIEELDGGFAFTK